MPNVILPPTSTLDRDAVRALPPTWRRLDAGHALNALVCRVMGIPGRTRYCASTNGGASSMFDDEKRSVVEAFIADYRARMPDSLPAQCEVAELVLYPWISHGGMSETWRVVDAARRAFPSRFQSVSLTAWSYNRAYATFDAQHFADYDPEWWEEARGEHATPLAICRAALAAAVTVVDAEDRA